MRTHLFWVHSAELRVRVLPANAASGPDKESEAVFSASNDPGNQPAPHCITDQVNRLDDTVTVHTLSYYLMCRLRVH